MKKKEIINPLSAKALKQQKKRNSTTALQRT